MAKNLYIALGEANEPKWYGLASGVGHMVMTPIATVGGDHIGSGTMITVCGNKPLDTDKVEHKPTGSAMCKRCTSRLDKALCADAIAMTMETDAIERGDIVAKVDDTDTPTPVKAKKGKKSKKGERDAAVTAERERLAAQEDKRKRESGYVTDIDKAYRAAVQEDIARTAESRTVPAVDDAADVARIKSDAAKSKEERGAKLPKYGKGLSERREPVVAHNNGETRIGAEPANSAAIVRGSVGSKARGTDPKPRKEGAKPRGTTLDAPLGQIRFDPEVVGKKSKPHYSRTQRRNWQRKQAKAAQRAEAQQARNNRTGR